MTLSKTMSLFIRLGLALLSLVIIGWLWWPAPVEANDPIFHDVCHPDDGTPCQELTSNSGDNWSRDVALGDLDGNGTIDAFVVQGSGSGPQSNVIWLGDSGGDCPNPFNYELHFCEGDLVGGGDSRGVALADLDGDTDLDVFIANGGSGDTSDEVWLNQGGTQGGVPGAFIQTQVIPNGASEAVALADLNNDTYPDAIVAESPQRIYWNQGDGTFNLIATTDVANNSPVYDVAVADLDNDAQPDIVLAGEGDSFFSDATQVFWNESSGPLSATITAGPVLSTSLGINGGLGLGPLNNDAFPDVFIANSGANKVWFSNGDRTFTAGADLGSDDDTNVALADFEGDGDLDAFVTRLVGFPSPNGVWLNDGSGGFSAGMDSLGSGSSYAVALVDMDNDSDPDAFVANSGPNKVYSNSFQDPVPPGFFAHSGQELDGFFSTVVVGDVDGDNDLDAITGGYDYSYIWVNQGGDQAGTEGVYSQGQTLPVEARDDIALGDVDGDSDLDLVVGLSLVGDPTLLYLNQGGLQGGTQGMFADSGQNLGNGHNAVELGDVDGDTDLDMMLLKFGGPGQLLINQGGDQGGTPGQFQDSGQAFSGEGFPDDIDLHDLDNDTDLDLFITNIDEAIWLNDGNGVFSSTGELGLSADKAGFGDFDNDADADIFAITLNYNRIYTNQGGAQGGTLGTFAEGGQLLNEGGQAVEIGDLTGDGIPDAFVTGYNNFNIWHSNGTGTFSLAQNFAGGNDTRDVALGDLDGDGDLDAFLATENGGEVWLNGEDIGSIVTIGPTLIQGAFGENYFHWWGTGNASLPLYLTHAATETLDLEVHFYYKIGSEIDSYTDPISFAAGDTLEYATAFSDEPGGADDEVWNLYHGITPIPAENWPMEVDLTLLSPNLSLIGPDTFNLYFHSPNAVVRNCYLEGIALMLELAGIDVDAKISAAANSLDLQLFRDLRDNVMADSPQGLYYTGLYNAHSPELLQITASNTWLISDTLTVLLDWTPALQVLVDGNGDTLTIEAGMVRDIEDLLRAYKGLASPELRAVIEAEEAALDLPSFIGLDMDQAWTKVQEREIREIWLPIILKQ